MYVFRVYPLLNNTRIATGSAEHCTITAFIPQLLKPIWKLHNVLGVLLFGKSVIGIARSQCRSQLPFGYYIGGPLSRWYIREWSAFEVARRRWAACIRYRAYGHCCFRSVVTGRGRLFSIYHHLEYWSPILLHPLFLYARCYSLTLLLSP